MEGGNHILIVDDDPRIRQMLGQYLEDEGFEVSLAKGGTEMREHMSRGPIDLVLLDHIIPGEDGLSLLKSLRSRSDVPVIMITGKGEIFDRVVGLEVGADDYIAKPFHLREVLARIRAVMRRSLAAHEPQSETQTPANTDQIYQFSGWKLDPAQRELHAPDGQQVNLTTGEFNLLLAFLKAPQRILDRDKLMDALRGRDWTPFDRSIDTQVGRLRKKIETDPTNPELIKTVRGVGYIFASKVERAQT